jgi:hypothetical protein
VVANFRRGLVALKFELLVCWPERGRKFPSRARCPSVSEKFQCGLVVGCGARRWSRGSVRGSSQLEARLGWRGLVSVGGGSSRLEGARLSSRGSSWPGVSSSWPGLSSSWVVFRGSSLLVTSPMGSVQARHGSVRARRGLGAGTSWARCGLIVAQRWLGAGSSWPLVRACRLTVARCRGSSCPRSSVRVRRGSVAGCGARRGSVLPGHGSVWTHRGPSRLIVARCGLGVGPSWPWCRLVEAEVALRNAFAADEW